MGDLVEELRVVTGVLAYCVLELQVLSSYFLVHHSLTASSEEEMVFH